MIILINVEIIGKFADNYKYLEEIGLSDIYK